MLIENIPIYIRTIQKYKQVKSTQLKQMHAID